MPKEYFDFQCIFFSRFYTVVLPVMQFVFLACMEWGCSPYVVVWSLAVYCVAGVSLFLSLLFIGILPPLPPPPPRGPAVHRREGADAGARGRLPRPHRSGDPRRPVLWRVDGAGSHSCIRAIILSSCKFFFASGVSSTQAGIAILCPIGRRGKRKVLCEGTKL